MSGGSYDYLCFAQDLEDILQKRYALDQMAERLEGLSELEFPGAAAAASETRKMFIQLRMWETHTETWLKLLKPVWKAVEWKDSGDWLDNVIKEELEKFIQS